MCVDLVFCYLLLHNNVPVCNTQWFTCMLFSLFAGMVLQKRHVLIIVRVVSTFGRSNQPTAFSFDSITPFCLWNLHNIFCHLLIFLSTLMRTLRHGRIFCWFNLIRFGCFFVCDFKQVLFHVFSAIRLFRTVEFVLRNNDQRTTKPHNDHKFYNNPPLKISHIEFNRTPNSMRSKKENDGKKTISFNRFD